MGAVGLSLKDAGQIILFENIDVCFYSYFFLFLLNGTLSKVSAIFFILFIFKGSSGFSRRT